MQIGTSIFSSKITRRFFILFFTCALLPMGLFFWISYDRVSEQLYEQKANVLKNDTKIYGMALMDRLMYMDNLLHLYSSYVHPQSNFESLPKSLRGQLDNNFSGISLYLDDHTLVTLMGNPVVQNKGLYFESLLVPGSKTTIYSETSEDKNKPVVLIFPFVAGDARHGLLIGQPKSDVLWGVGAQSVLPPMTELAVYNELGNSMLSTALSPGSRLPSTDSGTINSNYRQFEYTVDNEVYMASGWSLFLQSYFNAQTWTVILSESRVDAMTAMLEFKRTFPLLVALTMWIILFLSFYFIRRTLAPVTVLHRATEKVAAKDFGNKVKIQSGDEFEQLADSFNLMTSQLKRQFNALEVRNQINRSMLSSLDQSVIIPRALRMMFDFLNCRSITLVQLVQWEQRRISVVSLAGSARNDLQEEYCSISEAERQLLFGDKEYHVLNEQTETLSFIINISEADTYLILPMGLEERINGAIILGLEAADEETRREEISQTRQLANQLAIALSNSRLFSDLEKLSIGTVEALARTVDAKSKWTAGHSERVADLAVRMGRAMGFKTEALGKLHRAGLLHDIGKIGIPVKLLDKPGKLTDEEYDAIKTHPAIGGKILEPIEVYQDIIPIVEQHHERYDGKGYPQGLTGKEIDLSARILCVADVYDALISQRPYREGWIKEKVLSFVNENKGVMFDPEVADVLLALDI